MTPEPDTLPKLLLRNAQKYGTRKVAIREKAYGIWQTYTWDQYLENVKYFALGLASVGFLPGDKLAIIGDNRPELYWALLAAQCLGGVPTPLHQDSTPREVQYVVDHSDSRFVVAEDQEQMDKLLELKGDLLRVKHIICTDSKGMRHYQDRLLVNFFRVQELGRQLEAEHPGYFEEQLSRGQAEDVALLCYTSGTTGAPKGALLSHYNLISSVTNALQVDLLDSRDEMMAYLPMAWIGDTFWSVVGSLVAGFAINCPEEPQTVLQDTREIGPTTFVATPRVWENLLSQVQTRMGEADLVKRTLYRFFMPLAEQVETRRLQRQSVSWSLWLLHRLGEFLVYGPIRDHLGLSHIRYAYTGGAALGPEVFLFFRSLGINLKQFYGQTEIGTLATMHRNGQAKLETVGQPVPGVEMRIAENEEIAIRGPGVFLGYYKNPEATAQALQDGWFYSGDAGCFNAAGHLVMIDRVKDLSHLLDGTRFAPQYIENRLKFSPYIKEAVVVGQGRPFVAAMINVDSGTVSKWAEKQGIPYNSYQDLSQKPEVYDLVCQELSRANQTLPEAIRIKKFTLLHKELDPDDEEITRTRKIRRTYVAQKYASIFEAFYTGTTEARVNAVVTYQDGQRAQVETALKIRDLEPPFAG